MTNLTRQQHKLHTRLKFKDYSLENEWFSHPIITELRQRIKYFLPKDFLYDPQDLEHQVLFRLTTFMPETITLKVIKMVIKEQTVLLKQRMAKLEKQIDLKYLFRGLTGDAKDLNIHRRLLIKKQNDSYFAYNTNYQFKIEFKKINDPKIIDIFTDKLHYIHNKRAKGDTFGLYFQGDSLPWGIETTEPAIISKPYKRDALLAHGINPIRAIELTRLYLLPGSPENAISILDRLVAKYYKNMGIEAIFTTTMPMYAKTKGATIAGGMGKVLLIKELRHSFCPVSINGNIVYRLVSNEFVKKHPTPNCITTHPLFPTLYTVETYMPINSISLPPLPVLKDKVIYIHRKTYSIEKEIKFLIDDIDAILTKLSTIAKYQYTVFIRDTIFGVSKKEPKIRLRTTNQFDYVYITVEQKKRLKVSQSNVIYEEEDLLYKGKSLAEAMKQIKKRGNYKPENSYEKIRILYKNHQINLSVDIYPYGAVLEIEGPEETILETATTLGLNPTQAIKLNADQLYLKWIKEHKLPELWHIRFGLSNKFENKSK